MIKDNIVKHLFENEILTSKQYGFLSGRSTILQLLKLLDIWTEVLDDGGQIDCLYLYFHLILYHREDYFLNLKVVE